MARKQAAKPAAKKKATRKTGAKRSTTKAARKKLTKRKAAPKVARKKLTKRKAAPKAAARTGTARPGKQARRPKVERAAAAAPVDRFREALAARRRRLLSGLGS